MLKTTTRQNLGNASYLGATGSLPLVIAKSAIPFINVSSGTMGNNGALSAITALGRTYANAYMWFPAGAIAAGVPAAASWLFVQMSSTTAGTVFNNTYTTGIPTIPASPTAFATTGPGAFTGDTGEVFGPTISVPANSMGTSGQLRSYTVWSFTNSAGNKLLRLRFSGNGGVAFIAQTRTTEVGWSQIATIANSGLTNSQISVNASSAGGLGTTGGGATTTAAVDTTAATTLVHSQQKAAAADNVVIEIITDELIPG